MISNSTYDTIFWLTLLAIVFLIIVLFIGVYGKSKKNYNKYVSDQHDLNEQIRNKRNQLQSLSAQSQMAIPFNQRKQRHEEVVDTLDWMMQNNIITPTEYNTLIIKSLPFLD